MKISQRYPGLAYDYIEGKFYKIASLEPFSIERELLADLNANLSYKCNISGALVKKNAKILAYEVLHDCFVVGKTVYFKDLNTSNFKGSNLGCIRKEEYLRLKDALRNLNGFLKIVPHKTDAYVYVVKYRNNSKVCSIICHDIIQAHKIKRRIQIKSSKILSKYLTSD